MKARIADLLGSEKYYGTRIILELTEADEEGIEFANEIVVWISGGSPSQRQMEAWDGADRRDEIGTEHYESRQSLDTAERIVAVLERD